MSRAAQRMVVGAAAITLLVTSACQSVLDDLSPAGLCGDGIVQSEFGEQCDPAAPNAPPCSTSCQLERCGNGVIDRGEQCDEGLDNDDSGDCTLKCKKARCGDGLLHLRGSRPFEVCDDGNRQNGDGCNHRCSLRGRVSVFTGTPGGKGVSDGTGGAARFGGIDGLVADGDVVYIGDAEACAIRRLDLPTGAVTTIAGRAGACARTITDGPAAQATFTAAAKRLALAGSDLYIGEGAALRRLDLTNASVNSCARLAEPLVGITALVASPSALYLAGFAGVYRMALPCDCTTQGNCQLERIAGTLQSVGDTDGVGLDARFYYITGMALDALGATLYITDLTTVRQLDLASLAVTRLAGGQAGHVDGDTAAARFYRLQGIAHRPSSAGDELFVVERSSATDASGTSSLGWGSVRRLQQTATGWQVSTLAGTHGTISIGTTGEADGFGVFARLLEPGPVALTNDVLLLGEAAALRSISLSSDQVVTAAGQLVADFGSFDVQAVAARAGKLYAPTFAGELYEYPLATSVPRRSVPLCQRAGVRPIKVHLVRALANSESAVYAYDKGIPGICRIDLTGQRGQPCCAACSETCEVIADLAGTNLNWQVGAMAYDENQGKLYLSDRAGQRLYTIDENESPALPVPLPVSVPLTDPWGLALVAGKLYVADFGAHQLLEVEPQSGATRFLASGLARSEDGRGANASICHPTALASDGVSLFVAETDCPTPSPGARYHGHGLRELDLETGEVTTLLGPGEGSRVIPGLGARASLNRPAAMAFDTTTGRLYLADAWDNVLVEVD